MTKEYREYAKSRIEYLLKICRLDERDKEALKAAIQALSQEPCEDTLSRQAVLDTLDTTDKFIDEDRTIENYKALLKECYKVLPPVTQKSGEWIPVSERLPDNTDPVNITWVNHDPEPYYATIKDKPFTATGHYCNGRWWWYSVSCQDFLDEYGHCDIDAMDDAIEVIAWMPLPKPYEPQEREDLGDYPDAIHNQFDNMTGSMNL